MTSTSRPSLAAVLTAPAHPAPGVVFIHGFTQTHTSWDPVAHHFRGNWRVLQVDLPGHGDSPRARAGVEAAAALLSQTVDAALGPGRVALVGYSMGGRIALRAALDCPERYAALALLGASPGLADATSRAERAHADALLAAELARIGVSRFLDQWLSGPLFATLDPRHAGRPERERNDADALADALRFLGPGSQAPLWDRLGELSVPTLLLAGELDPRYRSVATTMAAQIGEHARAAIVPGAGHAAHLEQPDHTARLLNRFLCSVQQGLTQLETL